jgi:SAM-dependent methyltransferase
MACPSDLRRSSRASSNLRNQQRDRTARQSDAPRPQQLVAAGYDRLGDRYARWASRVVGDPRGRYVEKLLSLIATDPIVLEIGCGSGLEPTPTLARFGRLVGVDISRAQIDRARAALPSAEFIHADITSASFASSSFDAAVGLFVFTHIPCTELPTLLRRIGGWLRPLGLLLATFGCGSRHETNVDDWLGVPMFFSGFEETTNESLVRDARLVVLESRIEQMREPETPTGPASLRIDFHWVLAQKPGGA